MASMPKQVNGNTNKNSPQGKRKKSRGSKGSYLSKWLDKTMCHIQEATPSLDTYDSFVHPNMNWPSAQFAPGYDPCRFNMFGYSEPMSLPTPPTYCSPVMPPMYPPEYRYLPSVNKSVQVQRPRPRRRSDNKPEECHSTPNSTLNSNYMTPKNCLDNQDFASLPPIVTSVGDTNSNSDMNTNEKDDCNARRYSDPCVQGLPDIARPANGDMDSSSESSSGLSGSQVGSRLLTYLLDQITSLKMNNERLNKDLQETKAELNNMRQQHGIWQKESNSSIAGNGMIGGQYSPGFVTDLVREIRDSARIREEALYARVRSMVMERTGVENGLASPESKFSEKTLEEIKSSLRSSEADKRRMMDRIMKLEDELRTLRVSSSLESTENGVMNGNTEDADAERLRKELAVMRKAKQNAEEHAFKLERLVTQLRSKFNGLQVSPNGPDSIPSDPEHDTNARTRRTSVNSTNTTVVFGPVTDL